MEVKIPKMSVMQKQTSRCSDSRLVRTHPFPCATCPCLFLSSVPCLAPALLTQTSRLQQEGLGSDFEYDQDEQVIIDVDEDGDEEDGANGGEDEDADDDGDGGDGGDRDGGDDDEDEDDDDDDGAAHPAARRREQLGSIFEQYIYAIRRHRQGAARNQFGKAWYVIVKVESFLHRAPLEVPFFKTEEEANAWALASEANLSKRQKKGCFIYNHFMPAH